MHILGIGGSPRKCGNTDILLDCALQGARDAGANTTKVVLNDLKISPCQECGGCGKDGTCVIKDDMQGLYVKLIETDAVIVASPVFFGSLSAQTKIMVDRCQLFWIKKNVLNQNIPFSKDRPGAFLAAAGTGRKDFFNNAKSIIKNFFATIEVNYKKELFCPNMNRKGEVIKDKTCCDKAYEIGKSLARITSK